MSNPTKRGFYVVGEGSDGTGKSTHIELLAEYLKKEYDLEVYVMREPGGSPMSSAIRKIVKNGDLERDAITNLLLFTAARHQTWFNEALPVLQNGGIVLSDRNFVSSEVYQGVAEGLGVQYVHGVTRAFMDERYMNPDITVVFQMDDELSKKLVKNRGKLSNPDAFESRGDDFLEKISQGYKTVAEERDYPVIDAGKSIESVQKNLKKLVTRAIIAKGLS